MISSIRDEKEIRLELMSEALLKTKDTNNRYRGLSVKQIAQESCRLQHGLAIVPGGEKLIELAMQATSDFSYVLENVARKQLLARYALINPTYRIWCKASTNPDFKTMSRVRVSETPAFLKVPEGGQITIGLMSDSKESYALGTYGRGVSFTRQMLVNDDLGAFDAMVSGFGQQAARLENKVVYAILNANANMSDAHALFDNTFHGNLGSGAIGNTGLDSMFASMGAQLGLDGVSRVAVVPRFLIVPKALESTARAVLMLTGPSLAATDQNWFAGRLEPVADGELAATVWYGAADPAECPGIEYCHLEGAEGPQLIRKENEGGVLGLNFYAFVDFAAKAVDWRGLYRSTGV